MNKNELWKKIEGYEKRYQVSSFGRVKSVGRYSRNGVKGRRWREPKAMLTSSNGIGYIKVGLTKNTKQLNMYVHRLVALAFIPNPRNKPEVNHIDGNKNNNRVTNLEWLTSRENTAHADKIGLLKDSTFKIIKVEVVLGNNKHLPFKSINEAAEYFDVWP